MMAPKRERVDDDPNLVNKIQRIEHAAPTSPIQRVANNDFSSSVKRKLADSKRTGQACDRCKVRKIRCDGRPEGCTPCEQNRTPCRTTDRITGRATIRGHAEAMETENEYLRNQIAALQSQLREVGVEPRPTPAYNPMRQSSLSYDNQGWTEDPRRTSLSPLSGYAPAAALKSEAQSLPQFKHGSIGDNYLGVAPGDSLLSHIKGTSLSVFGTEIDITDFTMNEKDYENTVMSYTNLISISFGGQAVEACPLPQYEVLRDYAMWYMRSMNPYTMLLDKPTFMNLIWRYGNDPNFTPSAPQTVMMHMMLATIQYQIATRNGQQAALLEESHAHYQYALCFYKELLMGKHRLEDVQALAMICHHLRNFPKPGPAWILTSLTYLFAIELGLHRSVSAWKDGPGNLSKLEIEMRKRLFWTLHALQVNMTGRLGRPMPISNEDIDVEFPEPINDCLSGEDSNLDTFQQCSFRVGICISKYTVWELEMYKTIYAVRPSPHTYVDNLKRLEAGIKQWKEELPYELQDPTRASPDTQIFALYLEYWYQSYQLQLHHPAVCRSADPAIQTSNLEKCGQAAQKMLSNCIEMMHKKSLDIPWINTVCYIAATFTTLFVSSMKKDELTPSDMTKLKSDMASWIDVFQECDRFLGSENKLKSAIAKIIDQSLNNINDSIVKRTATESLARVALEAPQHNNSATMYETNSYSEQLPAASNTVDPSLNAHGTGYTSNAGAVNPYDLGSNVPVSQQANTGYNQTSYTSGEDANINSSHAAAIAAANSSQAAQNSTYAYQNSQMVNHSNHAASYPANGFAPQDWRQWTRTYMQPQLGQPGEYLNTATTLMTLGRGGDAQGAGNHGNTHAGHASGPGIVDGNVNAVQPHVAPHWPEITFPTAANGHMNGQ